MKWQPTPAFLPGEFHGQRSLAGYSPWGPETGPRLSNQTIITKVKTSEDIFPKEYLFSWLPSYFHPTLISVAILMISELGRIFQSFISDEKFEGIL